MIIWNERRMEAAGFNLHFGETGVCTEMGLRTKLCRACEYVIKRSNWRLTPRLEWVRQVYVATDWSPRPGATESLEMDSRTLVVMFRACYQSAGTKPVQFPDDAYHTDSTLIGASGTSIYSPDRTEFAQRLIPLVASCWKESWELFHASTWSSHRLKWWPVRLWAHRELQPAFDLLENGELAPVPGGVNVAEAGLVDY